MQATGWNRAANARTIPKGEVLRFNNVPRNVYLARATARQQYALFYEYLKKGPHTAEELQQHVFVERSPHSHESAPTSLFLLTDSLPLSSFYPAPASTGSAMKPRFDQFTDKNLGCLFYKDG